jgi:hypothetical protein
MERKLKENAKVCQVHLIEIDSIRTSYQHNLALYLTEILICDEEWDNGIKKLEKERSKVWSNSIKETKKQYVNSFYIKAQKKIRNME